MAKIETIKNCELIQENIRDGYGSPMVHSDGTCDGYVYWSNEEPFELCKECILRNGREDDDTL